MKPGGVIGFVGEPINDHWWKHWGLRLDEEPLFVARSHGWFESGWTLEFITDCFERNGFILDMFKGGFAGGDIGIATSGAARRRNVPAKAATIGTAHKAFPHQDEEGEVPIDDQRYMTLIGDGTTLHGRPAFRHRGEEPGVLVYGPYVTLQAGEYEVAVLIKAPPLPARSGALRFDVVGDAGHGILFEKIVGADTVDTAEVSLATGRFARSQETGGVEIRLVVEAGSGWTASLPTLRRL